MIGVGASCLCHFVPLPEGQPISGLAVGGTIPAMKALIFYLGCDSLLMTLFSSAWNLQDYLTTYALF